MKVEAPPIDKILHPWPIIFDALNWTWVISNKPGMTYIITTHTGLTNLDVKVCRAPKYCRLQRFIPPNCNEPILLLGNKIYDMETSLIGLYYDPSSGSKQFILPEDEIESPMMTNLFFNELARTYVDDSTMFNIWWATANTHYMKLTVNNQQFCIWYNQQYGLWAIVKCLYFIKKWYPNSETLTITKGVENIIDLVANKNKSLVTYFYEILWSDCGHCAITPTTICPYGPPPADTNLPIKYDKKVNVKKNEIIEDLLLLEQYTTTGFPQNPIKPTIISDKVTMIPIN